jgi:hypothetical protein
VLTVVVVGDMAAVALKEEWAIDIMDTMLIAEVGSS